MLKKSKQVRFIAETQISYWCSYVCVLETGWINGFVATEIPATAAMPLHWIDDFHRLFMVTLTHDAVDQQLSID